jgi:serine/threonine-protein kinase
VQTEFGRYRLVRHLASGGMGEVYLAEAMGAAGFAKRLVIKTLRADLAEDPQLVRQFVAEGRLLEALDHPNIAQVLDLGRVGEVTFLALEYVEGFDLRAILRSMPQQPADQSQLRLPEVCVWYVLACVARALDHAQTRPGPDGQPLGIVHHDLTPSNVMVRRDGHVKLVDFGVARTAMMNRLSATALRGKLPYLAPEHVRMQPVDGRADLFALGLVAYELLVGAKAVDVSDPSGLEPAWQGLPERVRALTDLGVGPELVDLIGRLTAVEPGQRPATAADVADTAEHALVTQRAGSPARTLAEAVAPAFELLAARARSFDQTLAQLVGLAGAGDEATATLSLPGLDAVRLQAAVSLDVPKPPPQRLRKRWLTLALSLLVGSVGLGFWLGQKREPATEPPPQATGPKPEPTTAAKPDAQPAQVAAVPMPVPGTPVQVAIAVPAAEPTLGKPLDDGKSADDSKVKLVRDDDRDRLPAVAPAIVRFRVQPFGCEVRVDGVLRKPVGQSNRYAVSLPPGDHKLEVFDPVSGTRKSLAVRGLKPSEERVLDGGICLGADCPQ